MRNASTKMMSTMEDGTQNDNDRDGMAQSNHDSQSESMIPLTSRDQKSKNPWRSSQLWVLLMHITGYTFRIGVILMWYLANGMNGISMQSYSKELKSAEEATISAQSSQAGNEGDTRAIFLTIWSNTSLVTASQLLVGAVMGRILLFLVNRNISWNDITATHSYTLSLLHGFGSLSTNLGFMYGKASIVQVLKLLEPFETLILSHMLFSESSCGAGIVSSMSVVVGTAMSLLKQQSRQGSIATAAIVYALISGFTLSCRNVLQRKHSQQTLATKSTSAAASHDQRQTKQWSKLDKSLVQFTQMSFFAGSELAAFSILQLIALMIISVPTSSIFATNHLTARLMIWHPLYNVFSMITLGFSSALTHSLWNAGKRVFAIVLAMVWFGEELNHTTFMRLFLIGIGALWYSHESKKSKSSTSTALDISTKSHSPTSMIEHIKPIFALMTLLILYVSPE